MSLDNRPARDEPLTSVDQLVAFLREGEKPRERFRVGMEHEKIGVLAGGASPIPYAGERGIEALLSRLPRFGYDLFLEHGRPIAALQGGLSISLEPGGQLELSGRPFTCSHDLSRELRRHLALARALGAELGHAWLGVGYRPFGSVADAQWMPKGRYARMREHLSQTGALGLDMMTMTATVQANFDFSDEADMARKVRAATLVSPLVTALFANSPLREGRESGYLSFRTEVWRQTDPARSGLQASALRPDFGYRAYAEWALDVPMIFVRRGETYHDPQGRTFRRFLAEGFGGERATLSDWEDHLTTLFPEIRLKRVIEVRGADAGTADMCAALPTLWKGLLYDADALEAAGKLVAAGHAELVALSEDVSRRALRAKLGNRTVLELARELVDIAGAGLHHQQGCGRDEGRFLEPLRQIVADGRCPAELALAKLHGELGDDPRGLLDHWRIA
ncbi:MAG TPA: glutamate-cysteine ligase family protein [Myxococcales bacterium]|nr:glutamate-cysteine ligase family protein [Myxococcales bacterium]